ncbi:type IV toxin-antitoxin system AbiEi family antitoxin domain-containing protein [Micromonosporaceae bacterium Da 78-11]
MALLEEISLRQGGIVTRAQALHSGLTRDAVRFRLRSGRWQRLSSGTYATFTGEVPRSAWRWAAVLGAGDGAVLSHRSAAEELKLADQGRGAIHVTIPLTRRIAAPPGVVVHRSAHLAERRHPSRLPPQTRVEETVLDLAIASRSDDEAMAWIASACSGRLTTPDRVARALRRRQRVARRRELAALVGDAAIGCWSVLEWHYLRDVERAHGLPTAIRQDERSRSGGSYFDDVFYAGLGLRLELDGRAAHPAEARWRDFRRDNAAVEAGDAVLRYGAADIRDRPCEIAAQVAEVLRHNGWPDLEHPCGPTCDIYERS